MLSKRSVLVVPVVINTVIFILLSLIHFYWALGGRLWYNDVLPTNSRGSQTLNPGTIAGLIVALALLSFAFITIGNIGLFSRYIKMIYFRYGALLIAVIFFLRAIGDFRFIGFFKTIKHTRFAINDTQFFSPLCLFISILCLLIFVRRQNNS